MSLSRRLWVGAGVISIVIVVTLATLLLSNLYMDTQVPVTLGYRAMVTEVGSDIVLATGTWTREGATETSKLGSLLQTSRIICYRQRGLCLEARAEVSSGNLLTAELVEHEITSWNETTIVYRDDSPCAFEIYTIDRKTESVNGVGQSKNSALDSCKWVEKADWRLRLADGFKVWWDYRNNVQPLPLRLWHAVLGK